MKSTLFPPTLRFTAAITLFFFAWTNIAGAEEWQALMADKNQPAALPADADTASSQKLSIPSDLSYEFLEDTLSLTNAEENLMAPEATDFSFKPEDEQLYLDPEQFVAKGPGGVLKEVTKDNQGKISQVKTQTHVFDYTYAVDGKLAKITQSKLVAEQQISGGNLAAGILPTASSYYVDANYHPSYATDGKLGDTGAPSWGGANADGSQDWLQVDLGATKNIGALKYDTRFHSYFGNDIWQSSFKISGSLDGVNWFLLTEKESLTAPQLFTLLFEPKQVRYIKVHDIMSHYSAFDWWHFAYANEIQAFETVPTGNTSIVTEKEYHYSYNAENQIEKISEGADKEFVYERDAQGKILKIKQNTILQKDPTKNLLAGIAPVVSSTYDPSFSAANATDGKLGNDPVIGWAGSSINGIGEWLQVDLGSAKSIDHLKYDTRYNPSYGNSIWQSSFKISGSLDGVNWFLVTEKSGLTSPQLFDLTFSAKELRYIKVHDIISHFPSFAEWWHFAYVQEIQAFETPGIAEIRLGKEFIYEYDTQGRMQTLKIASPGLPQPTAPNLARGILPAVSSTSQYEAYRATDGALGDVAVGWTGANSDGIRDWLQIDLGSSQKIDRIRYDSRFHPFFGNTIWQSSFKISGSLDGVNWFLLTEKSGLTTPQLFDLTFNPTQARYVRVHDIRSHYPTFADWWHFAYVNELEIYPYTQPPAAPQVTLTSPGLTKNQSLTELNFIQNGNPVARPITALVEGENLRVQKFSNTPGYETFYFARIILDTIPPTGSIKINYDAAATNNRNVILNLLAMDANGVEAMSFAINSQAESAFSPWENFSTSKDLSLPNFEGPNYVNVRFRDKAGNIAFFYFDSIVLDFTPPVANSVTINNGAQFANSRDVALTLNASDDRSGLHEMRFSTDGGATWGNWLPYNNKPNVTLPDLQGDREIKVQFRDAAGSVSNVVSDSITLDTVLPSTALLSERYVFSRHYELQYQTSDTHLIGATDRKELIQLARGKNEIKRQIKDLAGNIREAKWIIHLDENAERGTFLDYDPNGNITSRIDSNARETKYEYDANNRLIKVTYANDTFVRYTYNERGDRTSMEDSTGTTIYIYDQANRLRRLIQPAGVIDYDYDNASNLIELSYGGATTKYTYDEVNRLTAVLEQKAGQPDKVTTYRYNDAGQVVSMSQPNGVIFDYIYDASGSLTNVFSGVKVGDVVIPRAQVDYFLDAAGSRTGSRVYNSSPSGNTHLEMSYQYDDFGRIVEEKTHDFSYTAPKVLTSTTKYTYDTAGNRRTKEIIPAVIDGSHPRLLTQYNYGLDNRLLDLTEEKWNASNVLIQSSQEKYFYDAAGNLIQKRTPEKTFHYEYDSENRLVMWTDEKDFIEFFYDGDGNRVAKRKNGETTHYLVDPTQEISQVLAELDSNGDVDNLYTYGLGRISSFDSAENASYYYFQDGLGSTVQMTDSTGFSKQSYTYDAFGNTLAASSGIVSNEFGYTGEQRDPETGLIYLRARYYDPTLGRFISRDPVLGTSNETQSLNSYLYVQNDPINLIDPKGTTAIAACEAAVVVLAVCAVYFAGKWNDGRPIPGAGYNFNVSYRDPFTWPNPRNNPPPWIKWAAGITVGTRLAKDLVDNPSIAQGLKHALSDIGQAMNNLSSSARDASYEVRRELSKAQDKLRKLRDDVQRKYDEAKKYLTGGPPGGGGGGWGRSLLGSYRSGSRGGVLLDKSLEITGTSINDISGVTFDPYTGQVVLLGEAGGTVPEIPMDYLINALRAVFGTIEDPGVTIDPVEDANGNPIWTQDQLVKHFGDIEDTALGWVVFEADRLMKSISHGKDNITNTETTPDGYNVSEGFIQSKPGMAEFQNMLTRWSRREGEQSSRFWFVPKEMKLVRSEGLDTFVFDNNSVQLLTEDLALRNGVEDPDAKLFADFFTSHYDQFAEIYPIFGELKKAARAVALAKFIRDHNIPIDLAWLENASLQPVPTPRTTPVGSNSVTWETTHSVPGGTQTIKHTATIQGGVTVDFINGANFGYLADTEGEAAGIHNDSLGERPNDLATSWNFTVDGKTYDASALSLAPTRKDSNFYWQESDLSFDTAGDFDLEWSRTFDSFTPTGTRLGFGWRFTPYTIESTETSVPYMINNQTRWLFPKIRFSDRENQQIEDMELSYLLQDGSLVYTPEGNATGTVLTVALDNTFTIEYEDRRKVHFLANGRLDHLEDQNGNRINYGYDVQGRLTSITDAETNRKINLIYDAAGRILRAEAPENKKIIYAYDLVTGDLKSAQQSWTGRTTTYEYDAEHRLSKVKDHTGKTMVQNTYDEIGRLKTQVDSEGNLREIDPNLLLHETVSTDMQNGAQEKQTYDSLHRLTSSQDALGNKTNYVYGGAYGPTEIQDARGNTMRSTYNFLGLESATIDAMGHTARMDYGGNFGDIRLVYNDEGTGIGQYFEYDDTGNLKSITEGVEAVRDEDGNLTGYFPTSLKTLYTYDSQGNIAGIIDPNSHATGYLYDLSGNLTKITDAKGKQTELTYETVAGVKTNRVSSIKDAMSRTVNFTYDAATENLTKISTAAGEVRYAYDERDRLKEIISPVQRITRFQYDANDRLKETRELGKVSDVTDDIVASFDYDQFGNLTSLAGPLGGATLFTYDLLNRLKRIITQESTPLSRIDQTKVENLTSSTATIKFSASETLSRAELHIYEEGRAAFRTVTLEGPLSGEMNFEVSGLAAGKSYEYEIEIMNAQGHHSVTHKRILKTLGQAAPEQALEGTQKVLGGVLGVTPTTANLGVYDSEVNYQIIQEYKVTVTPKLGGSSVVKTFPPIFQGTDGNYYLTTVVPIQNLLPNTEYNFQIEVVNYETVAFDKPSPRTGSFKTANPADTVGAAFTKNSVTAEVDRAIVEFNTNEPLLWAAIAVINASTGEREDSYYFKPGASAKLEIPDLKPDTTYIYRIFAMDLSGNESASTTPSFTTLQFDSTPPLILKNRVTERLASTAKVEVLTDTVLSSLALEYREKNTASWSSQSLVPTNRKNTLSLTGLSLGKEYEYRLKAVDAAGNRQEGPIQNLVAYQETEVSPQEDESGIFQLALDSEILTAAAQSGLVGWSLELAQKYLGSFMDKYDYLVFIPTLAGAKRLSLETKGAHSDSDTGSFYLGARNDISGLGQGIYDFRNEFGASSNGELEGMVFLDSGLNSGPDFRFSSSDFSKDYNLALWQNVLTQELAHRYGSFLTSQDNELNPFGLLGRAAAHWGVFFDADFSPLDGNDWVDNGDGTFTLQRSYIDEAAFKRSAEGMPYNDLDLYSMGLLPANQVKPMYVIENPMLEDGRKLRMHSSGNLVEIQQSNGTWTGPFYLGSDTVIKGTKKQITIQDIINLEGVRTPAVANSKKDFSVAYIAITNEEESSLDVLEMTQKLERFKDSFTGFFKEMTRNLGNLVFPDSGTRNALNIAGTNDVETQESLLFSQFSKQDHDHDPLDLKSIKPVDFDARVSKLFSENFSFETVTRLLTPAANGILSFFAKAPLELGSVLSQIPTIAMSPVALAPANLLAESLVLNLEKPVLFSELRDQQGIRTTNPFAPLLDTALMTPLELLDNVEALQFTTPDSLTAITTTPTIPSTSKASQPLVTPLNWNAFMSKESGKQRDDVVEKKLNKKIQKKRGILPQRSARK